MGLTDVMEIMNKIQAARDQANEILGKEDPFEGRPAAFALAVKALWDINCAREKKDPAVRETLLVESEPAAAKGSREPKVATWEELQHYLAFADAAYLEHKPLKEMLIKNGYIYVRHNTGVEPGRVAHYIAFHPQRREVLIGIKGTSTFSDLLTDIFTNAIQIEDLPENDSWAHSGIAEAALNLASEVEDLLRHIFMPLKYKVSITGHSLGAGTAAILGVILRKRVPQLFDKKWNFTGGKRGLRVFAFAPPPVLDKRTSLSCTDFVVSCVNSEDVIPRASVGNLVVSQQLLARIEKMLEENPAMNINDITPQVAHNLWQEARDAVKESTNFLCVPGEVILMYTFTRTNEEGGTNGSGGEETKEPATEIRQGTLVKDCQLWALRHIELTGSMASDHLCDSYKKRLEAASGKKCTVIEVLASEEEKVKEEEEEKEGKEEIAAAAAAAAADKEEESAKLGGGCEKRKAGDSKSNKDTRKSGWKKKVQSQFNRLVST